MKTGIELIAQIHSEFDTAQDRLLKEANEILLSYHEKAHEIEISSRLEKIGFKNVPTVKKSRAIKNKVVESYSQAELIEYYKNTYPFLKFLTESELKRICDKYGLVQNPVENYIGDVPTKNLKEIENAQPLLTNDTPINLFWCELKKDNSFFLCSGNGTWPGIWGSEWYKIPKRINGRHFANQYDADYYLQEKEGFTCRYLVKSVTNCVENRQGLFICAPKSQFTGANKSITKTEVKDPIVFRYVRGGIQVLTKWGLEANDSEMVLSILN